MVTAIFRRAREYLQLVRLRSFDTNTDAGRSAERHRRVILTALASAAARGTSVLTALISVPLTLHYLGTERYGMWATMSSFTAMAAFADLGIGNGVLSVVARASGREELHVVRNYVSSAFALLGGIGLLVLAATAFFYRLVPWDAFFNVTSAEARSEAAPAITMFIVCFALSLPLGIVQRVQLGMQLGFVANLWQCAASLAGLAGVLVAVWMKASLVWLVAAFAGAPVLVAGLNNLFFFAKVEPQFAPRRESASRFHAAELARIGFLFFALQLAVAVTFTSDNLVIAQQLGAKQVALYSVPDRLFAVASMIISLAVVPLWPAFGESLARGDHMWAHRTLVRATLLSAGVAGTVSLLLLFAGPTLMRLWVGREISAPFMLLLGFAVWRTIEATVGAASMYLNAVRLVRFQIVVATITATVAITLKILLVGRWGAAMVPWITIATYLVFTGLPGWLALRRIIRDSRNMKPRH